MTELELRALVVKTAQAWLGRKEADGSHHLIIDLYNTQKPLPRGYKMTYKDDWCAAFVTAVAIAAGITDIIPPECSCNAQIKLFQGLGRWVEDDAYVPLPGDVIYYDWEDSGSGDNKGVADHVGIVTKCLDGRITVIEGNMNDSVAYRHLSVNGRYIRGYGVPDYAAKATPEAKPWYQPYADWAVANGIADGTRGGEPATRGEVWAMLYRLANPKG